MSRNSQQLGAALRRNRKKQGLTQEDLAKRMNSRQATISKLEQGAPGTQLKTFFDVLTALNLEIVVKDRSTTSLKEMPEDLF